jgi:hypothetical protein
MFSNIYFYGKRKNTALVCNLEGKDARRASKVKLLNLLIPPAPQTAWDTA